MKHLINILLYVLIFLFPFGQLLRYKVHSNIYLNPQDIVVLIIALLVFVYYSKRKTKNEFGKFLAFQACFIGVGLISLIVNQILFRDISLVVSFLYVLRYASYLSLILIGPIIEFPGNIKKSLILSSVVFLIFGLTQYFFFNDLRNFKFLGWDDHLYRLFSSFLDPNYAGVMYVLLFLYFFYFVFTKPYRESYKELIFSFFTFLAIYLTFSRTALISLLVSVLTITIMNKQLKLLFLFLAASIIVLVTFSDVSVEGLNPFRTVSTSGRLISLQEVGTIIKKSNYMGVGLNGFRYAQIRYGTRNQAGAKISNADAGTDNSLLFVLATSGILGTFFFVVSFLFLIRQFVKEKLKINTFLIASYIGVIAGSLFLNVLFYTPILMWLFIVSSMRRKL